MFRTQPGLSNVYFRGKGGARGGFLFEYQPPHKPQKAVMPRYKRLSTEVADCEKRTSEIQYIDYLSAVAYNIS